MCTIDVMIAVYNGCYGCYAMLCYAVYVNAARQRVICMYVCMDV